MNKRQQQTNVETIDDCLPQTQCGLCGYAGCQPYAEAIVNQGERIDLCLPGGVETLSKLAQQLNEDATSMMTEMAQKAKPPMKAVIREDECIGCTKCIQACPVDAIIGAPKRMHTVIADECTGCELCVTPCPVDCIDMVAIAEQSPDKRQKQAQKAKQRYQNRLKRLQQRRQMKHQQYKQLKLGKGYQKQTLEARKAAIQAAVARRKSKNGSK